MYVYRVVVASWVLNFSVTNILVKKLKGRNIMTFPRPAQLAAHLDLVLEIQNIFWKCILRSCYRPTWLPLHSTLCINSGKTLDHTGSNIFFRRCFLSLFDFHTTWKKLTDFGNIPYQEIRHTVKKITLFQKNLCFRKTDLKWCLSHCWK